MAFWQFTLKICGDRVGFKMGCLFLILFGGFSNEMVTGKNLDDNSENKSSEVQSVISSFKLSFPYLRGSEYLIRHAFDPESGTLYILDHGRDYLLKVSPTGHVDTLMTEFFADDPRFYLFDVSPDREHLYFWEEELGEVYKLQLSTLDFYQVDETTVEKLMRGHVAVFCPDDLIYAFGGYGIWEEKNILLYFDENIKGWLKINHEGPRPPRSENPFMVFEHSGGVDLFHVLIPKNEQRRQFIYYQFDRYQPVWKEILEIDLPEAVILPEHRVVATHSYRFNADQKIFHLMDEYFFDVNQVRLLRTEGIIPDDVLQTVYYYSPLNKEWTRVGIVERDQFLNVHVSKVKLEDISFISLTRPPFLFRNKSFFLFLFIGGVSLILITIYVQKRNVTDEPQTPRIRLQRNSFGIKVLVDKKVVSLPDPKLTLIWELIYRMVEEKQTTLNMAELNQVLFNQEHLDSHVSRVRSKLIGLIQDQVGKEFIWIERNTLDKRFKVICINPDMVEIDS